MRREFRGRPRKAAETYLTLQEFVSELERLGSPLPERTVRFYVAQGLLPQPVRKPFPKADGRVAYFPRSSLLLAQRIGQWQEEGYKLKQIRSLLERPVKPKVSAEAAPEGWRKKMAFRFLRTWYGPERGRLLSEFFARVRAESSDFILVEAGRLRLTRELSLMMEEEAAAPLVADYFQRLSISEQQVWLDRFRSWQRSQDGPEVGGSDQQAWFPYQQMVGDLLLGLIPLEDFRRQISRIEERLFQIALSPSSTSEASSSELEIVFRRIVRRMAEHLGAMKNTQEPIEAAPLLDALEGLRIAIQALVEIRRMSKSMSELCLL